MKQHDEDIGTKKDLCLYRIQTAKENLNSARILFDAKEYKDANNRAYYAIFHAINAIHALNGKSYKRHKDAVANFNLGSTSRGDMPIIGTIKNVCK